jgi:uncharacterized protein
VKELVETIVRNLVDAPDDVEIVEEREGNRVYIEVHVAEDDRGSVIGRRGATVGALRTLLDGMGHRERLRVEIEVPD